MEPYITMRKRNYYAALILGFIIILLGGFYINSSSGIGYGMLGFGAGMCILLLEQRTNSIR